LNELRWTFAAAEDLQEIADYPFEKTPSTAAELIRRIYKARSTPKEFPNRGRIGKKQGTRELLIPSLPYIVIYQVGKNVVNILRILHAAREWPERQSEGESR
jgi:toxin ParE1/3/4